jgi:hypothetical protein
MGIDGIRIDMGYIDDDFIKHQHRIRLSLKIGERYYEKSYIVKNRRISDAHLFSIFLKVRIIHFKKLIGI